MSDLADIVHKIERRGLWWHVGPTLTRVAWASVAEHTATAATPALALAAALALHLKREKRLKIKRDPVTGERILYEWVFK